MLVNWNIVMMGCIGGLIPDLLRIVRVHTDPTLPPYLKTANFWIGLVGLVILGGLATWLLQATAPKEAFAYGFSAPELLSRALAARPAPAAIQPPVGGSSAGAPSVRSWWTR